MNTETLTQQPLKLRLIIDSLKAKAPAPLKLGIELEPLLNATDRELIHTPMEWRDIPGRYLFTEEGLQQYTELEHAFAEFRIELTGGQPPTLRRLKASMVVKPTAGLKAGIYFTNAFRIPSAALLLQGLSGLWMNSCVFCMSDAGQINDDFQRDMQVACKKAIEQFRQAHPTATVCGLPCIQTPMRGR